MLLDKAFWIKVGLALQKIAALLIFMVAHRFLTYMADLLLFNSEPEMKTYREWYTIATYAGFFAVYLNLLWEMIVTFIPAFGSPHKK